MTRHSRKRLAGALTAYSTLAVEEDAAANPQTPTTIRWEGCIVVEDELTGDGRLIESGALRWPDDLDEHPLPLRYCGTDIGFHDGAASVGRIYTIERRAGGVIWATGELLLSSEYGDEAAHGIREKINDGVSVDLDDVSFEIRVASEILDELEDITAAGPDTRDRTTVVEIASDDEIMVTTDGRIRAVTLVSLPAFASARISLIPASEAVPDDAAELDNLDDLDELDDLQAAVAPVAPPAAWFEDPRLTGPTPIVVTEEGRVYGHLATWDVCHTGSPAGENVCVTAPCSATGYARFHTGSLLTREGRTISVGKITMGTGHARANLNPAQTTMHYDNTGTAVVDVRAGEDSIGIWVAGALRPGVTDEQARVLRASPLSGDWRGVDGNLELHAALAVNVPGFPIPRPQGFVASGDLCSLVASGTLLPTSVLRVNPLTGEALSQEDLDTLRSIARRERAEAGAALASRVHAVQNRIRIERIVKQQQGER